jgi:hypothetical protein
LQHTTSTFFRGRLALLISPHSSVAAHTLASVSFQSPHPASRALVVQHCCLCYWRFASITPFRSCFLTSSRNQHRTNFTLCTREHRRGLVRRGHVTASRLNTYTGGNHHVVWTPSCRHEREARALLIYIGSRSWMHRWRVT